MKIFVIFWENADNYRGVVAGDDNMNEKMALEAYLEENPNESGVFAEEEKNFIDNTTPVYRY